MKPLTYIVFILIIAGCSDAPTQQAQVTPPETPAGMWKGQASTAYNDPTPHEFTFEISQTEYRDETQHIVVTVTGLGATWECTGGIGGGIGYYDDPPELSFATNPAGSGDPVKHWYIMFVGTYKPGVIEGRVTVRDANFMRFFQRNISMSR